MAKFWVTFGRGRGGAQPDDVRVTITATPVRGGEPRSVDALANGSGAHFGALVLDHEGWFRIDVRAHSPRATATSPPGSMPRMICGYGVQLETMARAYWMTFYREIRDPQALAAYARLAGPALEAAGGRFLARGLPSQVYEGGISDRTVLIEFESVAQAVAAHDSPGYQEALRALGNGAERDLRIVEGVEQK
jgi:uncharacterized protein (DUF1330 family)